MKSFWDSKISTTSPEPEVSKTKKQGFLSKTVGSLLSPTKSKHKAAPPVGSLSTDFTSGGDAGGSGGGVNDDAQGSPGSDAMPLGASFDSGLKKRGFLSKLGRAASRGAAAKNDLTQSQSDSQNQPEYQQEQDTSAAASGADVYADELEEVSSVMATPPRNRRTAALRREEALSRASSYQSPTPLAHGGMLMGEGDADMMDVDDEYRQGYEEGHYREVPGRIPGDEGDSSFYSSSPYSGYGPSPFNATRPVAEYDDIDYGGVGMGEYADSVEPTLVIQNVLQQDSVAGRGSNGGGGSSALTPNFLRFARSVDADTREDTLRLPQQHYGGPYADADETVALVDAAHLASAGQYQREADSVLLPQEASPVPVATAAAALPALQESLSPRLQSAADSPPVAGQQDDACVRVTASGDGLAAGVKTPTTDRVRHFDAATTPPPSAGPLEGLVARMLQLSGGEAPVATPLATAALTATEPASEPVAPPTVAAAVAASPLAAQVAQVIGLEHVQLQLPAEGSSASLSALQREPSAAAAAAAVLGRASSRSLDLVHSNAEQTPVSHQLEAIRRSTFDLPTDAPLLEEDAASGSASRSVASTPRDAALSQAGVLGSPPAVAAADEPEQQLTKPAEQEVFTKYAAVEAAVEVTDSSAAVVDGRAGEVLPAGDATAPAAIQLDEAQEEPQQAGAADAAAADGTVAGEEESGPAVPLELVPSPVDAEGASVELAVASPVSVSVDTRIQPLEAVAASMAGVPDADVAPPAVAAEPADSTAATDGDVLDAAIGQLEVAAIPTPSAELEAPAAESRVPEEGRVTNAADVAAAVDGVATDAVVATPVDADAASTPPAAADLAVESAAADLPAAGEGHTLADVAPEDVLASAAEMAGEQAPVLRDADADEQQLLPEQPAPLAASDADAVAALSSPAAEASKDASVEFAMPAVVDAKEAGGAADVEAAAPAELQEELPGDGVGVVLQQASMAGQQLHEQASQAGSLEDEEDTGSSMVVPPEHALSPEVLAEPIAAAASATAVAVTDQSTSDAIAPSAEASAASLGVSIAAGGGAGTPGAQSSAAGSAGPTAESSAEDFTRPVAFEMPEVMRRAFAAADSVPDSVRGSLALPALRAQQQEQPVGAAATAAAAALTAALGHQPELQGIEEEDSQGDEGGWSLRKAPQGLSRWDPAKAPSTDSAAHSPSLTSPTGVAVAGPPLDMLDLEEEDTFSLTGPPSPLSTGRRTRRRGSGAPFSAAGSGPRGGAGGASMRESMPLFVRASYQVEGGTLDDERLEDIAPFRHLHHATAAADAAAAVEAADSSATLLPIQEASLATVAESHASPASSASSKPGRYQPTPPPQGQQRSAVKPSSSIRSRSGELRKPASPAGSSISAASASPTAAEAAARAGSSPIGFTLGGPGSSSLLATPSTGTPKIGQGGGSRATGYGQAARPQSLATAIASAPLSSLQVRGLPSPSLLDNIEASPSMLYNPTPYTQARPQSQSGMAPGSAGRYAMSASPMHDHANNKTPTQTLDFASLAAGDGLGGASASTSSNNLLSRAPISPMHVYNMSMATPYRQAAAATATLHIDAALAAPLVDSSPFALDDYDTVDIGDEVQRIQRSLAGHGDSGRSQGFSPLHRVQEEEFARGSASSPSDVTELQVQMLVAKLSMVEAQLAAETQAKEGYKDQVSTLEFKIAGQAASDEMERAARSYVEDELTKVKAEREGLEAMLRRQESEYATLNSKYTELLLAHADAQSESTRERKEMMAAMEQAVAERNAALDQVGKWDMKVTALTSAQSDMQAALLAAQQTEEQLRASRAAQDAAIEGLKSQLDAKSAQLADANKAGADAVAKLQKAMEALIRAQRSEDTAKRQLHEAHSKLSGVSASYTKLQDERERDKMRAAEDLMHLKHKYAAKSNEVVQLTQKLQAAEAEKGELMNMCDQLLSQAEKH